MSENGVRVEYEVHFRRDRQRRKVVRQGPTPAPPPDTVPRIARLLALAHKWEGMVRRGEIKDYAEIARLMVLSRARVTQICDLALLAPAVQEKMLVDAAALESRSERCLRAALSATLWSDQQAGKRAYRGPRAT